MKSKVLQSVNNKVQALMLMSVYDAITKYVSGVYGEMCW